MSYTKILSQVPADYYERGTRTNFFQWLWHGWKWITLKSMLKGAEGKAVPAGQLRPRSEASKLVLDIGCADGNLTAKIAEFLPKTKVTGVDLYKKSIEFAKKKNPKVEFLVADARKLPFKNKQFDIITCVEALEHIPNNASAVAEIRRCLKDSGSFIVLQDTDSAVFNFIWFFWTKWKGKVWEGSHISCMKPPELVTLLKKNGFRIKEKKFSHFGLEVAIGACKK